MCIRDRNVYYYLDAQQQCHKPTAAAVRQAAFCPTWTQAAAARTASPVPVSYTHLTLPTILLV
eukprot:5751428-Pyramimonas_sp.AAC.1